MRVLSQPLWAVAAALVALVGTSKGASVADAPQRPNVVVLLADDMGFADPSFMRRRFKVPLGRAVETPVLDKLAAQGLSLSDAHAGAPVCAPSRCTFMTGLHTGRCPVRDNDIGTIADVRQTWASLLHEQGNYRTALFGKWGLGTKAQGGLPLDAGFEEFVGQVDQRNCHNYYPSHVYRGWDFTAVSKNYNASYASCGGWASLEKCEWSGDTFTRETLAFLSHHVASADTRPFAIFVSHTTPHAGDVGSNDEHGSPVPRIRRSRLAHMRNAWGLHEVQYAAAVAAFDEQAEIILDALDRLNLTANTLVMFSSDNGASNEGDHSYRFFNSSGPLRGFKRSLSEGGHRVPFVLRWPGVLPAGRWSDVHFNFYDWLPTLAGFLGLPLTETNIDGKDKSGALRGQSHSPVANQYMEYCGPHEHPKGFGQLVRNGSLAFLCFGPRTGKLPACGHTSDLVVFDLASDLSQTHQLAKENVPELQAEAALATMHREHRLQSHCGSLAVDEVLDIA